MATKGASRTNLKRSYNGRYLLVENSLFSAHDFREEKGNASCFRQLYLNKACSLTFFIFLIFAVGQSLIITIIADTEVYSKGNSAVRK